MEEIVRRREQIERAGLGWSVVESVPVHEDIRQAKGDAERYLANYGETLRNLARCGIRVVCYNFMPLLDWTRTQLGVKLADGAETSRFDAVDCALFDLHILKRAGAQKTIPSDIFQRAEARCGTMSPEDCAALSRTILMGLPGTVDDLTLDEFRAQLHDYAGVDSTRLRENHARFLRELTPIAEKCGIALAIHPDDPPFPILGLPRIASTGDDLAKILAAVDSPSNGITFCTGSLGANALNDIPALFRQVGARVHFIHLRNVQREVDGSFFEAEHLEGSVDMPAVMQAILEESERRASHGDFMPIPFRPDHGHRMLGDLEQGFYPGYSAIGRLRGLAELRGVERGLRHRAGRGHQ
jgi:mannonate dehydratase